MLHDTQDNSNNSHHQSSRGEFLKTHQIWEFSEVSELFQVFGLPVELSKDSATNPQPNKKILRLDRFVILCESHNLHMSNFEICCFPPSGVASKDSASHHIMHQKPFSDNTYKKKQFQIHHSSCIDSRHSKQISQRLLNPKMNLPSLKESRIFASFSTDAPKDFKSFILCRGSRKHAVEGECFAPHHSPKIFI